MALFPPPPPPQIGQKAKPRQRAVMGTGGALPFGGRAGVVEAGEAVGSELPAPAACQPFREAGFCGKPGAKSQET